MNQQRRKIGRRFLCVLVAAMVSLLLVVLPFAQTLDASDSGRDSGRIGVQDSGAAPDFEYEDADIIVTAKLSDHSAIPADAEFCVEPITQEKDSAAFQDVETQINKDVKADHQTVTGLRAYNIYFSANGTRYEPESGDVTVTIQYKDRIFDSAVKKATDEIKVLHLKETNGKTKVEDVTKAVDVKDLGGDKAKKPVSSAEAVSEEDVKDGSEHIDGDTVKFVTKSFSTFVVTGIKAGTTPTLPVSLTFKETTGTPSAIGGQYYLYVTCPNYVAKDGNQGTFWYTLPLTVNSSTGIANATLSGLLNQNGQMQNGNTLYPLINGSSYSAVLFQYLGSTDKILPSFKWDSQNDTPQKGYFSYDSGSKIADKYLVSYPTTINVGTDKLVITAKAVKGPQYSDTDILNRLSPTLPYGVFAETYNIANDEDGNIAVNNAEVHSNFGFSTCNFISYSTANSIIVNKTYDGPKPATFHFALYDNCNNLVGSFQDLTLPSLTGQNNGTVSFDNICGSIGLDKYTVKELDGNGNVIVQGGKPIPLDSSGGGFTLFSAGQTGGTQPNTTANHTSYVRKFTSIAGSIALKNTQIDKLIVGKDCDVRYDQSNSYVYCNGNYVYAAPHNIVKETVTPYIDITSDLNDMTTLSTELAQAVTSDTVMVENFTPDQFNKAFFIVPSKKILLINIDASNASGNIDFSDKLNAAWASGSYNNQVSPGGWVPEANRVIINVFQKGKDGKYAPFSGTINHACYSIGTILAPQANVYTVTTFNGRIIANYVKNECGEIHCLDTGTTGYSITWSFINKYVPPSTPYTLPETGGGGTAIFYTTGGAVLLFGSVLAYVYRLSGKRRHIRKRRRNSLTE